MTNNERLTVDVRNDGGFERRICQFPNQMGYLQCISAEHIPQLLEQDKKELQEPGVLFTRLNNPDKIQLDVRAATNVSDALGNLSLSSLSEVMILARPNKPLSEKQVLSLADDVSFYLNQTSYTSSSYGYYTDVFDSVWLSHSDQEDLVAIVEFMCRVLALYGLHEFESLWECFASDKEDAYAFTHDVLLAKGNLSNLNVSERLQLTYNGEVYAHGVLALNGFVLFKGSRVRGDKESFVLDDSSEKEAADLWSMRVLYFGDGTVIDDRLTRDVAIFTSDDAAGLVLGELVDGGEVWQTADGRPLNKLPIYRDHLIAMLEMLR